MRAWAENGVVRRWFYSTDKGEVPILPDEIIHFKEWNPWNEIRGVTPLISLSQEIEQDQRANSATTKLLRNNAVPEGILKTDQVLREEEAGIKTINYVLLERDLEPKKWGDIWYRPTRLVPVSIDRGEESSDNKDAYPGSKVADVQKATGA